MKRTKAEAMFPLVVRPWGYKFTCPHCGAAYTDDARDVGHVPKDGLVSALNCFDCELPMEIEYPYEVVHL